MDLMFIAHIMKLMLSIFSGKNETDLFEFPENLAAHANTWQISIQSPPEGGAWRGVDEDFDSVCCR